MNRLAAKNINLYKILSSIIFSNNEFMSTIGDPDIDPFGSSSVDPSFKVVDIDVIRYLGTNVINSKNEIESSFFPDEILDILSSTVTGYYDKPTDQFYETNMLENVIASANLSSLYYFDLEDKDLYGYFEANGNSGYFRLTQKNISYEFNFDQLNAILKTESSLSAGVYDLILGKKLVYNNKIPESNELEVNLLLKDENENVVNDIDDDAQFEFEIHQRVSGDITYIYERR